MKKRNRAFEGEGQMTGSAFIKPAPGTLQTPTQIAQWVKTTVRIMDGCGSGSEMLDLAAFLVAASVVGVDEHKITEILNLNAKCAAVWAGNLRRNGLCLSDGRLLDADWFGDGGVTVFSLHCLVAEGLVERWIDPAKGPVYHVVPGRHILEDN